jgi:hypothetical protein
MFSQQKEELEKPLSSGGDQFSNTHTSIVAADNFMLQGEDDDFNLHNAYFSNGKIVCSKIAAGD